jgi:fucose 4-O-acetylase-like acetyltransferase
MKTFEFIETMEEKRLSYLDYGRVFVAYLVVFGHLLQEDNHIPRYYIYAFHMPFFFLVSGMLHKFNGKIQWEKYLRTIGVPMLFFNLFFFFIVNPFYFRFVYGDYPNETFWNTFVLCFPSLWEGLLGTGNLPSGVTWFLLVLLWCKLLQDVVFCNKKVGWTIFAFLFVVTIGLHITFLWIRNAMMVFPFYYVGCKYKDLIRKMVFQSNALVYALICLLLLIGLVLLNGRASVCTVGFGDKTVPFILRVCLFYMAAFIGSLMMLFVSTRFENNRAVVFLAKSLITILGMQAIFCDPYRELCEEGHYEIMIPLAFVILIACSCIHWLITKYAPFLLGKTN